MGTSIHSTQSAKPASEKFNDESTMKDVLAQIISTRRTVRRYDDKPVPHEKLEALLRFSTHAPSACNRRGWRFILIEEQRELDWLYVKGGAAFIPKGKQAILACYFRHTDNGEWRDVEQSAAAAIAYFQLLAHAEGIGSCWICHLPPRGEVRRHFKIPSNYTPVALLTVGYYIKGMDFPVRNTEVDEILALKEWAFAEAPNKDAVGVKLLLRRVFRKMYYLFPKREWLRNLTHKFEKKFENHD